MDCIRDSSSTADFQKMWQAARSRWLRPTEIYDILINSHAFSINKEPLNLPPSGTLVLFNRKLLRNFRKDGHPWRKKKDNRTVKEAHEHLKVGSEEKIHVYYAHGEEGVSNLQRRAYWLLDKTLEHIVLVHYLEVTESMKNNTQSNILPSMQPELQVPQYPSSSSFDSPVNSAIPGRRMPLDFNDFTSHESDDFDDKFSFDDFESAQPMIPEQRHWESGGISTDYQMQFIDDGMFNSQTYMQCPIEIQDSPPPNSSLSSSFANGNNTMELPQSEGHGTPISSPGIGEVFKKLDSLERWMEKEFPDHTHSPSVNSCSDMDSPIQDEIQNNVKETIPLLSAESRTLTPVNPQIYFKIEDFSPMWTFTSEDVKVIIICKIHEDIRDISKIQWYCMFDGVEVLAEIVQPGVFRCTSPKIANPGTVSFCITDGNGRVYSDFQGFEFRSRPENQKHTTDLGSDQTYDDLSLQCKLTQLLLDNMSTCESKVQKLHNGISSKPSRISELMRYLDQEWMTSGNLPFDRAGTISEFKEKLLQVMFEHKMIEEINRTSMIQGKKWLSFNQEGQTAFHLAAALGYEWVIDVIVDSQISLDFRDRQGWTALHWAALHDREKMVASLLAAGAKPGTVTDPTPEKPQGCTPADIASSRGYTGLAGYLSEKALIYHLNSLTLEENSSDKRSAEDEGHRVVEYLRRSQSLRRSIKTWDDEIAFEESLNAVGQATATSARIHAAFRTYFLKERLHAIEETDEYGFSLDEQIAVRKLQSAYRRHREQRRKDAALQIQNQFRGWKTRKDFLTLRQNVVKIQAFFRMHQARKKYHQLLWSVGVLEKAVLRWRQRRKGLRGYQVEANQVQGSEDFLRIGRKQAEESVERATVLVQSMVKSGTAREQYRRMQDNFKQAQLASSASSRSSE